MTDCACGGTHEKAVDEEIVETEDVELAAGLDEPVEVGKEEALMKDMEATLAKLKEVLAYLEGEMEEKAEEDEEEDVGGRDIGRDPVDPFGPVGDLFDDLFEGIAPVVERRGQVLAE